MLCSYLHVLGSLREGKRVPCRINQTVLSNMYSFYSASAGDVTCDEFKPYLCSLTQHFILQNFEN